MSKQARRGFSMRKIARQLGRSLNAVSDQKLVVTARVPRGLRRLPWKAVAASKWHRLLELTFHTAISFREKFLVA